MKVQTAFDAGEINFNGSHVLFVEGEPDSIDVSVLSFVLDVSVKPLGTCAYVRSAAQAMHQAFPNYYFLVDRDQMSDDEVEDLWKKFPRADTPNLLAWRKKEIESYFIDPDYVIQSKYFVKGKKITDVQKALVRAASPLVYMAAANCVIISVREKLKRKWIEKFTDIRDFPDAGSALKKLLSVHEFGSQVHKMTSLTEADKLRQAFEEALRELLGTCKKPVWGEGRWLELLPAKGLMHSLLGSSLFRVYDRNKQLLSGMPKVEEIIKDLVTPGKKYPADFIELEHLLKLQMQGVS